MRKTYGLSQELSCPFCGGQATGKNAEGLPACRHHTKESLALKCLCKEWLDVKESKHGPFFLCMNCGPISYAKGLEINNLPLPRVDEV
ncbi:MAG: hypothetical protein OXR66_01720 [Candidatus Woesearchaeota archaeon]|nr:hypothetical protein [Candidatus Woesearchaeota archaeon]